MLRIILLALVIHSYVCLALAEEPKNTNNNPITQLYSEHKDMASDKWVNYFDIYNLNFSEFIGKNSDLLEIGVQNGGSLQILAKYLKNGSIYGVDIDPKVCSNELGDNIKTFCFDIKDKDMFNKSLEGKTFDIIIDDGSHMPQDIKNAFEYLFEKVKPGGVYLIEGIHTSYWKPFNGGVKKSGTAMEYFKELSDYLNYYSFEEDDKKLANHALVEKYTQWINHITFYDSVIVIKKLKTPKLKPYSRIAVGTKQPVAPTIDAGKIGSYYYDNDTRK